MRSECLIFIKKVKNEEKKRGKTPYSTSPLLGCIIAPKLVGGDIFTSVGFAESFKDARMFDEANKDKKTSSSNAFSS